jgi:spore coat polysaccharide biosynthesis protein SpsF (cytidylyltransferase family)
MWPFNKFKKLVDPYVGKTVIRFTTHGCMAQIHQFDYIGTIVDFKRNDSGLKLYIVEVLKCGSLEKRDRNLKSEQETIASHYLQNIGGNFLVAYD